VLINEHVFDAMLAHSDKLALFGLTMTYSGHPVGAAVAREAIRIYEEDGIVARVREMESVLIGGLRERLASSAIVGEVRGRGLLAGVQLAAQKSPKLLFDPALKIGPRVGLVAEQHGLFVRAIGDVIAICPPLTISEAEIGMLIDRLAAAIHDVETTL
jgi:4-aminobutyrate--pyruvate transaminase